MIDEDYQKNLHYAENVYDKYVHGLSPSDMA